MRSTLPLLSAVVGLAILGALAPAAPAATLPTPKEFLHLDVGADRVLADYRQIRSYFAELDRLSPRVQVSSLGKSTLGEDMVMAVITSEANQARLPRLKEIAKRLADPRGRTDAEIAALAEEGRAFLLITCNIHATEIGSTQMAMEWAHALAAAEDAETKRRLDEVVLLLVPSLNPDGQIMETEWYRQWLGTPYEGGRQPRLYHHYVGHDNNRDWYMLTQAETKAMTRAVYHEWFPQVWLDEHQMGTTGPRIFMPPYSEPVDEDIHPLVWREVNRMGADMALRLEQADKSGVIYGYAFDAYWPGGTKNTAWFKNVSGLLTEVASCRLATPLYVDPSELAGGRKGLVDYEPQTNFPNPWPGGWWRLRDIMDYERIASDALLESCADLRRDVLRDMAVRARAAITQSPPGDGFRIPGAQRDRASAWKLAALLVEHGVEVYRVNDDLWVPLAQPYGNFVREMLTTQRYPEVKLVPGKDIVRPYDVAAWSLPLMMGVEVVRENRAVSAVAPPRFVPGERPAPRAAGPAALTPESPQRAALLNAALRSGGRIAVLDHDVTERDRTWPAGTAVLDAKAAAAAAAVASDVTLAGAPSATGRALAAPRVAIYQGFTASMDEGWTRWLLERHGFDPKPLGNAAIQKGGLRAAWDALVLPDVPKDAIATGRMRREDGGASYQPDLPPGYRGGLEAAGAAAVKAFVNEGGTVVAMGAACDWVLEQFNLPVGNALAKVPAAEFGCPGSLLRAQVAANHPVTWGMPAEAALFVDKPIAFATQPPGGELDRAVLATYPADPRDVLLSGWIEGADKLTRRSAAVAVTIGRGKLVLLGFRPQYRAQTDGTFPLLFNALWWSTLAD